jgi:hypothetical protein
MRYLNYGFMKLALLVCGLWVPICYGEQHVAPSALEFRILFEGNNVGHINLEKQLLPESLRTIETLELKTQFRGMKPLTTRIIETQEEDNQGRPLRFAKRVEIPNASHQVWGEVQGSELIVHYKRGATESTEKRNIPDNFLLNEGLRGEMQRAALKHESLTYSAWDYDAKEFVTKTLSFHEEDKSLHTWRTTESTTTTTDTQEQILDADFLPIKSSFDYLGKKLELIRCTSHCNNEHLSALRPLDQQMLDSPYQITDSALKGHIRYEIQTGDTYSPAQTQEQKIRKTESAWIVDVCAHCANYQTSEVVNSSEYLGETPWMETNDKILNMALTKIIKADDTPSKRMEKLSLFTRKRLEANPQFAGYASAKQAYETRTGDCTEYALLLATLGRIAKVPTRVVFGLSYSREYFHGRKNAFAPHAWVQAWIDGAWRSYDAALDVFDAGHIALKISDGNPQDFRAMFDSFNQLKIDSAQQVVPKKPIAQ